YSTIKPQILAEPIILDTNKELNDYKFLCFNGEPYFVWVDVDRNGNHQRTVFDLNWNEQPWTQHKYPRVLNKINKPLNFDKMIDIARQLSKGFDHVRIDLYNVDGKIYF